MEHGNPETLKRSSNSSRLTRIRPILIKQSMHDPPKMQRRAIDIGERRVPFVEEQRKVSSPHNNRIHSIPLLQRMSDRCQVPVLLFGPSPLLEQLQIRVVNRLHLIWRRPNDLNITGEAV